MEQITITYCPLGKAFEKQIKTIEDQEKKQIKQLKIKDTLKQLKNMLMMLKILHLSQKEILNELVDERREKITDSDKNVNSNDLIHRFKSNTVDVKFDKFNNALNIIN